MGFDSFAGRGRVEVYMGRPKGPLFVTLPVLLVLILSFLQSASAR